MPAGRIGGRRPSRRRARLSVDVGNVPSMCDRPTPAEAFDLARYSRQIRFGPIGPAGQRRLSAARATLVGCGALGSALANLLVRAGLGSLRIIDRDFIELNNLQRQTLLDEQDIAEDLPKAEAAARKLRRINSAVRVEALVADFGPDNAVGYCHDADLILDGTDNLETRYLINDVAVKLGIPWVFGSVVAAEGLVLPIWPHRSPCLRCLWEEPPAPGSLPTCDTVGVLAAAVNIVASLQATEAMKLILATPRARSSPAGSADSPDPGRQPPMWTPARLLAVDAWSGRIRSLNVQAAYDEGNCPCCKQGRFEFLSGARAGGAVTLCGSRAVQVMPGSALRPDFQAIIARLPAAARPTFNSFLLRFTVEGYEVALFADGRAIIRGTDNPAAARAVYAKYVGL